MLWAEKRLGGQCVSFARSYGYNITGNANQWPKNAVIAGYALNETPTVGAVVVTTEHSVGSHTGHVAIVEKVDDDFVYVIESNYIRLTVSHGKIPRDSKIIVVYIHKT